MKNKLLKLSLLLFLVVCSITHVLGSTVVDIWTGTTSETKRSKVPLSNDEEYTDLTTGFKYELKGWKDALIDISSYTNQSTYGVSKGLQQGGSTASSNHFKLVVPSGYTASIYVVYGVTSSQPKYFGLNATSALQPNGSNCSKWNATVSANTTLTSATISSVAAGTYYLLGNASNCVFAKVQVTLTSGSSGYTLTASPTVINPMTEASKTGAITTTITNSPVTGITSGTTTSTSSNTFTVAKATPVTVTAPMTVAGTSAQCDECTYRFDSWENIPASVTADVSNIHAKYNTTYTISFKETDESAVDGISSTYYVYGTGKAVSSYPTPTKSGFNFNGWYQENTLTNAATNIGTTAYGNVTVYAKWTEVCADPTLPTNGAGTTTTQTVSWTAGGSETEWDVYYSTSSGTPAADQTPTYSPTSASYTFTGLTAGTTYYWWVRAKCSATSKSDWVAGTSFTTRYCDAYSFHYGPNGGSWETPICFTQVGETHEWNIENFTIPSHANGEFWVGYAGATNGQSVTKRWTDGLSDTGSGIMNGAMVLLPTNGSIVGQASGATGTLSIWDDSESKNQYVGFKPDGYAIMYGGNNYAFSETATSNVWETDLLTLPDVSTTYQVGIKTASSYTTCSHSRAAEALSAPANTMRKNGKKMLYLVPGVWRTGANNEHMAVWDATNSEWGNGGEFLTWNSSTNKYEGYVSGSAETIVFVRVDVNESSPTWTDGKWHNKTSDITLNLIDNQFSITGWGSSTSTYTQTPYSHPATGDNGKFRMYDNSNDANWYVHWIPYYKLSYDGNGGTGSVAAQYRNSELSTSPLIVAANGFSREGWTFTGWNTEKHGKGTAYDPDDNIDITGDVTLYAQWERDIYFKVGAGWGADNAWYAIYCFDNSDDSKYTWVALTTLADCETDVYKGSLPGNSFDKIIVCRMNKASKTLSFDNKWNQTGNLEYPTTNFQFTPTNLDGNNCTGSWSAYSAPTYTITFAANGGSGEMSSISSIACDANQTITANAFTKTGYSFAGWKANVDVTIDDATVTAGIVIDDEKTIQNIRSNITLTAQWTIDTHTVTYYANGGSGTTTDSSPYDYGSTVTTISNSFTNSGYKFKWWNTASNGSGEDFYVGEQFTIEEDADLFAQWESVGTGEEFWCGVPDEWHATTHDVTVGDMNVKPQDYESNHNGINKDFTGGNKEYTIVNASNKRAIVMAVGADNQYIQIHFTDDSPINELNLGITTDQTSNQNIVVCYSTTADFSTGQYEFKQVGGTANLVQVPGHNQSTKSVTDVSPSTENKYKYVRIYRKLTDGTDYNSTGAALGSSAKARIYSIKAKKGTIMRTITGAVSPAGYGTVSPSSISVEDGSKIDIDDDELTCDGKTLTATPTSDGVYYTYSFSSWSGTGVSDRATVSGDLTATANFTQTPVNYTLAWNANGGDALSGTYTSGPTGYGTAITAPNDPTRDGYTFTGWNSADDGSGDDYTETMPAENTTYYAQWTANKYDVEVTLTDATQKSGDTGEDKATHATNYVATFEAESGYKLPNDVTVNIGESKASGTEYTWSVSAGVGTLTIDGDYILDDITITVTAVEDVTTYSVTYADGGASSGSVPSDANSYYLDDEVTVLGKNTLSKSGYTFVGWSYNGYVYVEGDKFNITENATLTAVWNEDATTVTITNFETSKHNKSNDNKPDSQNYYLYGYKGSVSDANAVTLTTTSSNNYGLNEGVEIRVDRSSTLRIYADKATSTTPTSFSNVTSVEFDAKLYNSGNTERTTGYTIKVGSTTVGSGNIVGVAADGYKAISTGTFTAADGYIDIILGSGNSNNNLSVDNIAITCSASTYKKVTFNKGSGPSTVSGLPADRYVPSGSKIAEPSTDPTATGYTFGGWVTTSGGSTPFDFANTTITDNTTIYAKWTALPASTTPTLPSLSNTEACNASDFTTWNATPTNATAISTAGESVSYSWKNSSDAEVATTATYKPTAAGTYTVTVTVSKDGQLDASVTSGALTATLNTAASKTAEPTATITAIEGESFTISGLTASNATGYQWYSCNSTGGDKSELSGKTSATLTDTKEDDGTYYYICTIGNACGGGIDSRVVTVNVYDKCATFTSATSKQSETEAGTTKTISTETGGYAATLSGATMTFKGTSSAVGCNKDHGLVFDANDDVLTVTLTGGSLQAGTIIELGGKTVNENSKTFIFMVGSNAATPTYTTTEAANQAFTQRYVVEARDGICGTNSFTITKSSSMTGNKEYLNKLIVANCALCTPISPALTYSTSTLYVDPAPTTATATLTGYYGTPTITYASSNTDVATVNETTGEVTAVAPGTATITATIGETTVSTTDYCGAVAEAEITVAGCSVQEIAGVTLTAEDAGTPSGTLIASTSGYGVNTQKWEETPDGGCGAGSKLGSSGNYVFLTLSSGNYFQNGDKVVIDLAKVPDIPKEGTKILNVYAGSTSIGGTPNLVGTKTSPICGNNEIILSNVPASTSSITLYRNGDDMNPYVKSMKVYREICSDGLAKFTGAEDSDWDKTANWTGGKVASATDRALVLKPATVNIGHAVAKEVILDQNSGNTGKLTVSAGEALIIAETLQKTTDGSSLVATEPADIEINSTRGAGTGALIIGSHAGTNQATVNFESKVNCKSGDVNQYIGSPFSDEIPYVDYAIQMYKFAPTGTGSHGWWNKISYGDRMDPFMGYNLLTNDKSIDFLDLNGRTGHLNASSNMEMTIANGKMYYNSSWPENMFANGWLAPIHIDQFVDDDFVNVKKVIYIFNAGTPEQYEAVYGEGANSLGAESGNEANEAPGTYTVIPVKSASELAELGAVTKVIPSMQAFSVLATNSSPELKLNFKRLVYDPAKTAVDGGTSIGIEPTRAPRRMASDEYRPDAMRIRVRGENGWTANAYVLGREDFTDGYDDGWDGEYMEGDWSAPQLYSPTGDGSMVVNCVPEIEGTIIAFYAGSVDNNYTFSFVYNGENTWYLNDLREQKSVRIDAAQTYSFASASGDVAARFIISKTPIAMTPTGTGDIGDGQTEHARKVIIDDHVYIIRNGKMYNVTGSLVK